MALDLAQVSIAATWQQSKANTGFASTVQGPDSNALLATLAVGASDADSVYAASGTIASAGTVSIDLQSFTDQLGQAITMTRVYAMLVQTATGSLKVEPHGTNGLVWFFSGTTPAITLPPGGGFCFLQTTSQTVDATHKVVKLTNTGSPAVTLTYKITILGGP